MLYETASVCESHDSVISNRVTQISLQYFFLILNRIASIADVLFSSVFYEFSTILISAHPPLKGNFLMFALVFGGGGGDGDGLVHHQSVCEVMNAFESFGTEQEKIGQCHAVMPNLRRFP